MNDIVIKAENISKLYNLGEIGTGTLSHDLNRWWSKLKGNDDPYSKIDPSNKTNNNNYIWALKDINLEVPQGEILGIIGRNGAGKSTILKLISRITTPTNGIIKIKGTMSSLLEVGTGMHPALTARENIYLNGAILGMKKSEITKKFDNIVDFAGCSLYVDTPIKRFSSGMRVRLGFSVAAFLEPDILIIDEVLAVGDIEFRNQATEKMKEVSESKGKTILFVSHNMMTIRSLCERAVLIDSGKIIKDSNDVNSVVEMYHSGTHSKQLKNKLIIQHANYPDIFQLHEFYIGDADGNVIIKPVTNKSDIYVYVDATVQNPHQSLEFGYDLYTANDTLLYRSLTSYNYKDNRDFLKKGRNVFRTKVPEGYLNISKYRVEFQAAIHRSLWLYEPNENISVEFEINMLADVSPFIEETPPGVIAPVIPWHKFNS